MSCGADTNANTLLTSLIAGKDFTLPDVDLSDPAYEFPADDEITPPAALTLDMLTTKVVGGTGGFDVIMSSIKAHLADEYEKSRITGAEFTKAYIELTTAALSGAIQYLTTKDAAYFQAIEAQYRAKVAQAQVVEARVNLETAKARLAVARLEAANQEATYALTKMKLSTEDVAYCTAKFNLDEILPQSKLLLVEQVEKAVYENTYLLPAQKLILDDQHDTAAYNLANILPKQVEALTDAHNISVYQVGTLMPAQKKLVDEQMETQRANTMNTRSDGATTTVGLVGKQKDLYTQQITSYQRDAEVKAAKLFTDAWITMKTIDEGLLPPGNFDNTSLNNILGDIKTNNSLG